MPCNRMSITENETEWPVDYLLINSWGCKFLRQYPSAWHLSFFWGVLHWFNSHTKYSFMNCRNKEDDWPKLLIPNWEVRIRALNWASSAIAVSEPAMEHWDACASLNLVHANPARWLPSRKMWNLKFRDCQPQCHNEIRTVGYLLPWYPLMLQLSGLLPTALVFHYTAGLTGVMQVNFLLKQTHTRTLHFTVTAFQFFHPDETPMRHIMPTWPRDAEKPSGPRNRRKGHRQ